MVDVFCNFICNEENYFNCFDILVVFEDKNWICEVCI